MAPQMASYPNALRTCIKQAGYSFREVSRETAIPESTLYDWAAGNRPISHRERQVLARLVGCEEHDLQPHPADKGLLPIGTGFHERIVHPSIFDLGVTEKLDSAESLITLAWETWFASRPREVARSVIKLLPDLEKIAYSPYMLLFVQALWTKGRQGESCVICTAGESLVSPHGSTDKGRSCFPWQLSWANR
jgi:hypothetical protein